MVSIRSKSVLSSTLFVILHVCFWVLFLATPLVFRNHPPPNPGPRPPSLPDYYFLIFNLLDIPFFYINAYYLIPKILRKKGIVWYIFLVLGVVFVALIINHSIREYLFHLHNPVRGGFKRPFHIGNLFPLFFTWAFSTSFRIVSDNLVMEQNRKEQETERLKSELSFLRSQVSPHFMFNVLNSLAALARKKSELVEPVIIKLSELMRYMLYESADTQVSLDKEVQYLQSYIDLQKLRFGDDVKIIFEIVHPMASQSIEPMLLIPFVENAFKHGVGMIEQPIIELTLEANEKRLIFTIKNKVNQLFQEKKDRASGIGLANVKRRLDLLYPDAHSLEVIQQDTIYQVILELDFKHDRVLSLKKSTL
ncbi:sensor histidine kinase [Xanthocytophaga agilis]|uniref:sensor histidine kinase n=1 Tax=Xanthocytophaga agilis TaxID=3048010 RepID=UPI0028D85BB6|nr:histidine kinase [Xanthocytophaga agilis]